MTYKICLFMLGIFVSGAAYSSQEDSAKTGKTGSESVFINGKPAKRAGDIPGAVFSPNVFANGQPVVIGCQKGFTPVLSPNVFVNGKPKVLDCQKSE